MKAGPWTGHRRIAAQRMIDNDVSGRGQAFPVNFSTASMRNVLPVRPSTVPEMVGGCSRRRRARNPFMRVSTYFAEIFDPVIRRAGASGCCAFEDVQWKEEI